MKSVDLMSLWNAVCSVLLCSSVRNRKHPLYDTTHKQHAGEFFLSQSAQSSLSILAHVSSTQKASGIQISQSVKTIIDTNKGQHKADFLLIGVSRLSLPFPPGEGSGGGAAIFMGLCVFCSSV